MAKPDKASVKADTSKPASSARRSVNLALTDESFKRLSHHAIATNTTVSALVVAFALTLPAYVATTPDNDPS